MRKAGLSKQKTAYIRDLARKTNKGHVKFETLADLPDHEVIEHLTQVKGIGVWTAHMFLIFALRRPDVLATGRSGRPRRDPQSVSAGGAAASASRWKNWQSPGGRIRSVAVWYLWRSLEGPAQI